MDTLDIESAVSQAIWFLHNLGWIRKDGSPSLTMFDVNVITCTLAFDKCFHSHIWRDNFPEVLVIGWLCDTSNQIRL